MFGLVGLPSEGGGVAAEAGGDGWRYVGCAGFGGALGGLDAEDGQAAGEAELGLGLRVVEEDDVSGGGPGGGLVAFRGGEEEADEG